MKKLSIIGLLVLFMTNMAVAQSASKGVVVKHDQAKRVVEVFVDGSLFTAYRWMDTVYKPVLYPVNSPAGQPVTRGWPIVPRPNERIDHPHHVGHWFNYGDVNGHDFWNNSTQIGKEHKGPFGKIRHDRVLSVKNGATEGSLKVATSWLDKDGKAMLSEITTFTFIKVSNKHYRVKRTSELKALNGTVSFKDNKEGMFAIRLCRELEQPSNKQEIYLDAAGRPTTVAAMNNEGVSGRYKASTGIQGDSVWGTRAAWVETSGLINGQKTTVRITDSEENVGYPTYWHARGYGLFAANPLGAAVFSNGKEQMNFLLQAGKTVSFTFTIDVLVD